MTKKDYTGNIVVKKYQKQQKVTCTLINKTMNNVRVKIILRNQKHLKPGKTLLAHKIQFKNKNNKKNDSHSI